MIEHIVLIHWKDEAPQEQRDAVLREALTIAGIEGVVSVVTRHNLGVAKPERGKGIGDAIIITLVDEAALAAYSPHPIHRAFATQLLDAAGDLTIVDLPTTH
jgi:GNAT superfamily N-acetyltransferase